jgi:hypothetical protein
VIKISFGCTGEFRVKMWRTSSPEDKLAGDLGNVIEATSTGGRRSDFFTAEKLASGNLGLLQQYLPTADSCSAAKNHSITSSARNRIAVGSSMPIALAALRLTTSSNFVACSTGRSAAFVPLTIFAA